MSIDENEACFIYAPQTGNDGLPGRPSKRRKISTSRQNQETSGPNFPRLLDGLESVKLASLRQSTFEETWKAQSEELNKVLDDANSDIVRNVSHFILDSVTAEPGEERIPTGIIAAGLALTASGSLFSAIFQEVQSSQENVLISISASQCSNLKAALKLIIHLATQQDRAGSDDEPKTSTQRATRLLNYDLQLLHEWVQEHSVGRVVLFFQGSESLETPVFADLIDTLSSWQDRVPFVLVFEVATSLELFESRLPRKTLSQLKATVFEAKTVAEIFDVLFRAATGPAGERHLWLGPAASRLLLDRQIEHIQSASGFIMTLKYMHFMHFYNNALSVMLTEDSAVDFSKSHCQALRDLPSFQRHVKDLIDDGDDAKASELTTSNPHLASVAPEILRKSQKSLHGLSDSLQVLSTIHALTGNKSALTWSTLYIKAMSGELAESPLVRELSMSVKKMPSDVMVFLLESLSSTPALKLSNVLSSLKKLVTKSKSPRALRSEHDVQNTTLRTTVVAQKVSLSTHKEALSAQDAEYSKLVNRVDRELRGFFTKNLIRPKDLCFHEILIFDSKNACRDALGPAPRQVVERALSSPHDYLACDCCANKEGLAASQPTTALLYQMYLETGAVMNIADLWVAFQALIEPKHADDLQRGEEQLLALFYRSLAELKYLGMVKNSRRKADHLAKLKWKGL